MSGVAVAIGGAALVGAWASNKSAEAQAKAAQGGGDTQAAIGFANIASQEKLAAKQRKDFQPWREAGENALNQIQTGIDAGTFSMDSFDFTADPGYQFRLEEGVRARDASAAARGRLHSGAQDKAIEEFGQNIATSEYSNAYARAAEEKARKYNILSGVSSAGQASAAGQAQATSNLATTTGNIMSNTGRAMNVAEVGEGVARAGAYQDYATGINQATQNWLTYRQQQGV